MTLEIGLYPPPITEPDASLSAVSPDREHALSLSRTASKLLHGLRCISRSWLDVLPQDTSRILDGVHKGVLIGGTDEGQLHEPEIKPPRDNSLPGRPRRPRLSNAASPINHCRAPYSRRARRRHSPLCAFNDKDGNDKGSNGEKNHRYDQGRRVGSHR